MKSIIIIVFLVLGMGMAKSQTYSGVVLSDGAGKITLTRNDTLYVDPSKAKLNIIRIVQEYRDTVKAHIEGYTFRNATTVFSTGAQTWINGYFINNLGTYLDKDKKPINKYFRVTKYTPFEW